MQKKLLTILFFAFLSFDVCAQNSRETSFDQRPACEEAKGVWREFGNGCLDQCRPKLDRFAICTQAIQSGCDCGKSKCWDGETCVALKDYKKLYDKEVSEEKVVLEVEKKARKAKYKDAAEAHLEDVNKKAADKSIFDDSPWAFNRSEDQTKKPDVILPVESKPDPKSKLEPGPIALPPFFLQQEKAKQGQAVPTSQPNTKADPNLAKPGNSGNAAKKDNSDLFKIPVLPDIPLPN